MTKILENDGYELHCQVKELEVPKDTYHVRFFSMFDKAKDPKMDQNRYEMFLDAEQLEKLKYALDVNRTCEESC